MKVLLPILMIFIIFSCKKTITPTNIQNCDFRLNSNIGFEKPSRPVPGLFLLDFDGWGQYEGSNATPQQIIQVSNIIKDNFSTWDITVTTDESVYNSYQYKKQRIVFTNSPIGFLGVAIIGSMVNGDELNPALVYWYALQFYSNPMDLGGKVATHELGHTLGLYHIVDTCGQNYALPINGFVPTMGSVVDATTIGWVTQLNYNCIIQDDKNIISLTIKKRRR